MRITNQTTRDQFLTAVNQLQAKLSDNQNRIALGQSFTSPSQDPIAAGNVNRFNLALAQSEQYTRNGNAASNRLGYEDDALSQLQSALTRIRDLALQANNSTQSDENHAAIAKEVQQIRDSILSIANTQDGNGEYLFAGYSSKTQPFSLTASGATYAGDEGQRSLQVGAGLTIADSDNGATVFGKLKTGNGVVEASAAAGNTGGGALGAVTVSDPAAYDGGTYRINFVSSTSYEVRDSANALVTSGTFSSGHSINFKGLQVPLNGSPAGGDSFNVAPSRNQELFTTLQNLLTTLGTSTSGAGALAKLNNGIGTAVNNIDQALRQSENVRASVGARLNGIDAQADLSDNAQLQLKTQISQLQDLDYASAITLLNQQLTSLSAAEQSYTLTQGLSLFKYL